MEEKFVCDICGEEYENRPKLAGHMQSHKKGRPQGRSRKDRIPLGEMRSRLSINPELRKKLKEQGKVPRWLNDNWHRKPARIDQALEGGYEFVRRDGGVVVSEEAVDRNTDLGDLVSCVVGSNQDGTPIRAFLMAIDTDLYEADQKAKQKEIDKKDDQIKHGTFENKLGKHGYVSNIEYSP